MKYAATVQLLYVRARGSTRDCIMIRRENNAEAYSVYIGPFSLDMPKETYHLKHEELLELATDIVTFLGYEVKIEGENDARKEVQDTPKVRNKNHHHARRQDS